MGGTYIDRALGHVGTVDVPLGLEQRLYHILGPTTHTQTDGQTDRQKDRQMDRQTEGRTNRQTDNRRHWQLSNQHPSNLHTGPRAARLVTNTLSITHTRDPLQSDDILDAAHF